MAEEASVSRLQVIIKRIKSIAHIITSKLPPSPPPPLLPVANIDAHPITQNLRKLEAGKLAFTLGTAAALALLSSQKFPSAGIGYLAVVGLMGGCAAVWNGVLFGKASVELLGMSLIFVCLYGLVGSFLPLSFSWACWLSGAFSLIPFLSLVFRPAAQ